MTESSAYVKTAQLKAPHRFRFSVRLLLLFAALCSALCYWWIARPTIVAQRFAREVARGDYHAVEMFDPPPSVSLDLREPNYKSILVVVLLQRSPSDLLRGEQPMKLVDYGVPISLNRPMPKRTNVAIHLVATPIGIRHAR